MASANLEDLNPAFRPLLNAYLASLDKAGIGYTVESGYRSPESQAEIYARSHQGRDFPAAPPWLSFHNYGLATDVIPKNVADYPRMHQLAAAAGLADARRGNVFTYDQPHVEMPGQLEDLVKQYHLASWRPADMPAPAQGALAYVGPSGQPSRVASGTSKAAMTPMDIVLQAESGDRPVNNVHQTTSSGQAQSYAQITTGTWNDFAPKAGVDLKQYPTPESAPRDVNLKVASVIPLNRWAASTVAKVKAVYPNIDTSKTLGEIQSAAISPQGGSQTASAAPAATGAPAVAQDGSAGHLPGFTPNSQAEKMTQAGLKELGLGEGGDQTDKPMTDSPMLGPAPMAAGGPMMAGPGYQNVTGRTVAQNNLANQGYLMGPSLAALVNPGSLPPLTGQSPAAGPSPGGVLPSMASATMGMPAGLPGTTLNSPSAAATAMLYGSLDPMDPYNRFGGGAAMQAANYGG